LLKCNNNFINKIKKQKKMADTKILDIIPENLRERLIKEVEQVLAERKLQEEEANNKIQAGTDEVNAIVNEIM